MRRLLITTASALLLLAGCTSDAEPDGSDGSGGAAPETSSPAAGSSSATPAPPGAAAPDCDDVWQAGKTLPRDYTTCLDGGEPSTPDVVACTDGSSLVVHLDTFYAITGRRVVEPDVAPLQDTDQFGEVYAACTGE